MQGIYVSGNEAVKDAQLGEKESKRGKKKKKKRKGSGGRQPWAPFGQSDFAAGLCWLSLDVWNQAVGGRPPASTLPDGDQHGLR